MNKVQNQYLPKLRFQSFKNNSGWDKCLLGELFYERGETGYASLPLLSLTDHEGIIPQEESKRKNTSSSDKSKYLRIVEGDVVYNTMRMWEGRSAYACTEGLVSPAYTVCVPKESVEGKFYSYLFKTQWMINEFHKFSQGLVKDTLSLKFDAFAKIPSFTTSHPEQKKIGDCLSSIDDLIELNAKKLESLKSHKKGLMQQLFPNEGKTVPSLRFQEFLKKEEWHEHALSEVCQTNPKGTALPERFIYIDLEAVKGGNLVLQKEIELSNAPSRAQRLLKKNDVIFQLVRPYQRNNFFCNFSDDRNYVASTGYAQLRAYENPLFLYYLIQTDDFVKKVLSNCSGSNYPAINSNTLADILIKIPSDSEQIKIAELLCLVDKLISSQSKKIKALRVYKCGLLQQLFPTLED